jgi:RNA polymerase sigma-70 factor (ECF subfamily)
VIAASRPPSVDRSDSELVQATLAGEPSAFSALFSRHADRVFALATRILGYVDGRNDVVQETFLQLHRALPSFRGDSQLSTFLYRIAVRVALHQGRRSRKAAQREAAGELDDLASDASLADRTEVRQELARAIALLDSLSQERRVAFVLVCLEGLTYDESAEVLGISADAVKQRVLRARADLKELITRAERAAQRKA